MASLESTCPVENNPQNQGQGDAGEGNDAFVSVEEGKPKKKVPRRILHFSDGILEEYSTDEEEENERKPLQPQVDPKTLKWLPWMWYYTSTAAYKAYLAADFCGEKLAWFFGITTPKYQSAIDEYYRRKAEEEKEREEELKRLSMAPSMNTIDTQLSESSIDVRIINQDIVSGDMVEKY